MLYQSGEPSVQNISLPVADVEQVVSLPANIKKILVQVRGLGDLKIAFTAGQSGTTFFTLKSSSTYFEDVIHGPVTLAMRCDIPNSVVEIVTWVHND